MTKSDLKMLFMVIERFRDNDMIPIYQRLWESGRSLPDGLEYVDSWIEPNFARCFVRRPETFPRVGSAMAWLRRYV